MDADRLKITIIVRNCRWAISSKLAKNVVAKEDKGAFNSPYIFQKIGDSEKNLAKSPPTPISQKVFFVKESVAKSIINL